MSNYSYGSLSSVGSDSVRFPELPQELPFKKIDKSIDLADFIGAGFASSTSQYVKCEIGMPSQSTLAKIRHSDGGIFAAVFRNIYQQDAYAGLTILVNLCKSGQLSNADATRWLFPYLTEKDGWCLDLVYFTMLQIGDPLTIAELAFRSFRESKSEKFFVLSVSILCDLRAKAFEGFDYWISNSTGREIEQYFFSVFNSDDFNLEQKKTWLNKLSNSTSFSIKEHLLENLEVIPEVSLRQNILLILLDDKDERIKHSADFAFKKYNF